MRNKILKHSFKVTFLSALPAITLYLATSKYIFPKLIEWKLVGTGVNIELLQEIFLWISVISSALFLSLNLIVEKIKSECAIEERNSLIQMNKKLFSNALAEAVSERNFPFDIRIFIPKYPMIYKIAKSLKCDIPTKFIIKNIDLIATPGITRNLQFEVYPNPEGLVGLCYKNKAMVYDDNLAKNNTRRRYHLGSDQLSRTANLKWSICCPIFDVRNNVVAMLALDGQSEITIDKDKAHDLQEQLIAFSRLLYDSVPQLFKR